MQSQKAAQICGIIASQRLLSDRMIDTTCSRHDVEGFLASADSGYVLCWARLDIVKASDNLPVDKGLCVVTCGALQCPSLFHLERHGWSWFCYRPVVPFLSHHFWLMTDSQMANKSVKGYWYGPLWQYSRWHQLKVALCAWLSWTLHFYYNYIHCGHVSS